MSAPDQPAPELPITTHKFSPPTRWRVEVCAKDEWHTNALRFSTHAEALAYAKDISSRWKSITACRLVEEGL